MAKVSDITKFKTQMNKLIADIHWFISEVELTPDIKIIKQKCEIVERVLGINPRDFIVLFIRNISPYAHQILKGDDAFFISSGKDLVVSDYSEFIDSLCKLWADLCETKRQLIKQHFKLLLMIGAITLKDEPLRLIINQYRNESNPLIY